MKQVSGVRIMDNEDIGTYNRLLMYQPKVLIAMVHDKVSDVPPPPPMPIVCRIFRNFAIFAKSRSKDDERFGRLEKAMRVSGLDDNEIDNYFSVMLTEKEMRPYIEGAKQQGYRTGLKDGVEKGKVEGRAEGRAEGRDAAMIDVAKSLLALGMPVEQIAQIAGLTLERIKSLSQG